MLLTEFIVHLIIVLTVTLWPFLIWQAIKDAKELNDQARQLNSRLQDLDLD